MRLLIVSGVAALLLLGSAAPVSAQMPIKPGQMASVSDIATPFSNADPGTSSSAVARATTIANVEDKHDRTVRRVWVASVFAMAAGTSLDAASSWGKQEGNSFLASSNGKFGAKGIALKGGIGAAMIVPEILLRKHKDLLTKFAVGNFALAAVYGAAAIHNLGISSPQN